MKQERNPQKALRRAVHKDSYAEGGEEAPLDGSDILFGGSEGDSEGGFVDDGFAYEEPEEE